MTVGDNQVPAKGQNVVGPSTAMDALNWWTSRWTFGPVGVCAARVTEQARRWGLGGLGVAWEPARRGLARHNRTV